MSQTQEEIQRVADLRAKIDEARRNVRELEQDLVAATTVVYVSIERMRNNDHSIESVARGTHHFSKVSHSSAWFDDKDPNVVIVQLQEALHGHHEPYRLVLGEAPQMTSHGSLRLGVFYSQEEAEACLVSNHPIAGYLAYSDWDEIDRSAVIPIFAVSGVQTYEDYSVEWSPNVPDTLFVRRHGYRTVEVKLDGVAVDHVPACSYKFRSTETDAKDWLKWQK